MQLVKLLDADSMFFKEANCSDCHEFEVRLLGIDAPEFMQEPWGKRAKNYVANQLNAASKIELEFAPNNIDKYGRKLVYVRYFTNDEDRLLNEVLLNRGFAVLFSFDKNSKYLQSLKDAQAFAQKNEFNIWRKKDGIKMSPYQFRKKNKKKHAG